VPEETMKDSLGKMREKMMGEAKAKFEALAKENKDKSDKFLPENKTKKGIVVLPSGVQYRVIEEGQRPPSRREQRGDGALPRLADQRVRVRQLVRAQPAGPFKVDSVLKGWQEVLPLMKIGDHWQIFLPPDLAYGLRGPGPDRPERGAGVRHQAGRHQVAPGWRYPRQARMAVDRGSSDCLVSSEHQRLKALGPRLRGGDEL
jgi:FKBP-type peptidyl-prolyl cis-trans isomerase